MIRYILVDDEPKIIESVKTKIDSIAKSFNLVHVKSFESSLKAFEEVNEVDYDLLIVDFEMPVYNGVELAKKVGVNKKIIFLTSTNNEKLVINNLDISGYLSKPFEIEEFQQILKNKVIGKIKLSPISNPNVTITLHLGRNRDVRFQLDQAFYLSTSRNFKSNQPDKNCVHIYGENDIVLIDNVRKSINELHSELKIHGFEKINQSTIINMLHIKERDNTNISLFHCKETFEVTAKEKLSFVGRLRAKFKS
ncbi:LytTR family DNA-binding domain-containing protein [Tenacibaculum sp. 1_MG-2023]|uniref:LytR/AlgR family response regulator transcription factor n=1 Tax=Tenacibaculum sp. 1_MG-2023 TaxID=3062653 RepID=UPI0026E36834|nr:response regulator [Tenacibaculum sp. 1_MG-2023]MDO6600639.1 response regulator [Tenacibaculum sp. 1_MG-2023]